MENEDCKWMVLVLKDRYANDSDRDAIEGLLKECLGLEPDDICHIPLASAPAFGNFIFVKERNPDEDLRECIECKREAFEPYPAHMRITGAELADLVGGIEKDAQKPRIRQGDIVLVKNGVYQKLYGIALREERTSKIDVGLKFCFGTVVEQCRACDLDVVGNLFKYIKVLK